MAERTKAKKLKMIVLFSSHPSPFLNKLNFTFNYFRKIISHLGLVQHQMCISIFIFFGFQIFITCLMIVNFFIYQFLNIKKMLYRFLLSRII